MIIDIFFLYSKILNYYFFSFIYTFLFVCFLCHVNALKFDIDH